MKKIGLGLERLPIEKLKTYYDLSVEQHRNSGANTSNVGSRFWFYPIVNRVNVLDDIVLLEKFQMGVFTEVLYAEVDGKPVSNVDKFEHYPSEGFARSFSEEYDAAAEKREVLETLRGLTRLAALAKGLPYVDQLPKVEFWLTVYKSESLKTCTNVEVLKAEDRGVGFVITGGVEMKALATRLNGGNVHVVSELVLHTRPKLTALTWTFELVSREGQIVGVLFPASRADSAQVAPLLMQAIFLENKKHYDAAIEAYTAVITLDPETVEAYNGRGTALEYKHEYDRAIDDYTKALAINPRYALAYSNRGNVYDYKGSYNNAILDYTKALQIDPSLAGAYYNRGVAHHQKGRYQEAIADFNHALDLKWSPDRVYFYRGLSFLEVRDYDKALADFTAAIESNPTFSEAYTSRAAIFAQQRQEYDRAIADCDHALQFTPELVVETYCIRGFAYENKLDLKAALGDYTKAIELKQTYAPAYMGRGWVWALTAQNDMAISDLSKAIELDPKLALAYSRRGAVYGDMGKYDKAKDDLERAILLDPDGPAGLTAKPVLKYLREKGAIKE
jgi:tetratricopeptide (TPR) repeat protein